MLDKIINGKIEIGRTEYKILLRNEERFEALIRYIEANKYIDRKDVAAIIGVDLKEEGKEDDN